MTFTVEFDDDQRVRLTNETIEADRADRIAFTAEGVVNPSKALLGAVEGATLKPVRVELSVGDTHTVTVDLEAATLRLENVDVGVETPDTGDLSTDGAAVRPSIDDSPEPPPGAIAFTVDGVVLGVTTETVDAIEAGSPAFESITFAAEGPVRGDGGPGADVLVEFTLLGYGIVVRRNGVVEIGAGGGPPGTDLLR